VHGKVSQDLADGGAELVAVAGETRRDDDVAVFRQRINGT